MADGRLGQFEGGAIPLRTMAVADWHEAKKAVARRPANMDFYWIARLGAHEFSAGGAIRDHSLSTPAFCRAFIAAVLLPPLLFFVVGILGVDAF